MVRVKVKNVVFHDKQVLHEGEISLQSGKLTVLKGPSGSGKSTILNTIAYHNEFLEAMTYDGQAIDVSDESAYRSFISEHIAIVTQTITLLEDLTVFAHIELYKELFHSDQDVEAYERLLDIDSLLERYPLQLSGGELKRVGFLLAVLQDKEFLMLDEPTASLDAMHRDGLLQLMKKLLEEGKTIFVTSHDKKMISEADNLYAIEQKRIVLIKSEDEQKPTYQKARQKPDVKVVQNYLKQTYRHHKTYHQVCRLFTVLCVSFIALCSQFEHYVSIRNGASLSSSISNQIVVYHQNQGVETEYLYDGTGIPITKEESTALEKINHVTKVKYRADVILNDIFSLYVKEHFDNNLNFDVTVEYPNEQKKIITEKEYNAIVMSSYIEGEDYSKSIQEDFHQPGVYISSSLARFVKQQDVSLKDTKISLNLLLPEYQVKDQYISDGKPITASVSTRVPVQLSIAGVLNEASMGVPTTYANMIYFPQSELESYVENSRKDEGEVIITAKEEDPVTLAYLQVDFYDEITDEIKQAGYTNFYTINYTPWIPAAYTVVVDSTSNVDEVIQEITSMGYDVLHENQNYHALSQGTKQLQTLARIVSMICMFIILCVFILMKYNDKEKEKEVNQFFLTMGFDKSEVWQIKERKYLQYASETALYTIVTIAVAIQFDHIFLHVGLNFHITLFVIAIVFVVFMELVIPLLFERRRDMLRYN